MVNVVIPMAGHSRRFKSAGYKPPKALLPVGSKMMIEHVISMFESKTCNFIVIINSEQKRENPRICSVLKDMSPNLTVTVIEPHDKGPVESVLKIPPLDDNEPFIVSYCDFFVTWNFERFLYETQNFDGAIPAFKGFHPASFGDTHYAYMRTDGNSKMLELREKQSFTTMRHNEPASAGIYYFKNFSIFKHYAERLVTSDCIELPEAYVSLVFNEMVEDGLDILVTDVDKFICLGTPNDYEQFLFWEKYFKHLHTLPRYTPSQREQVAIIPMAGKGKRFLEYGYRVAKPLIQVGGRPMVTHAVDSIPAQDKWIIIAKADDAEKHQINQIFDGMNLNYSVITTQGVTSGQAATCLLAEEQLDDNAEVFISSCDYYTIYDHDAWMKIYNDHSIDGVIWTTRLAGTPVKNFEAFAYCITNENDREIQKIVEKQTISSTPQFDPTVIGTFWFRRAADFKFAARQVIDMNITVNGEHYVATSINSLLSLGKKFIIFEVDQWISFGDPFEVEIMEYWREYFAQND